MVRVGIPPNDIFRQGMMEPFQDSETVSRREHTCVHSVHATLRQDRLGRKEERNIVQKSMERNVQSL